MTVVREQFQTLTEAANYVASTITLDDPPTDGSTLVLVAAIRPTGGTAPVFEVRDVRQEGAVWRRVVDAQGLAAARTHENADLRLEIWVAYNIEGASADVQITWIGGLSLRSVVLIEYSGGLPDQTIPADYVSTDDGETPGNEGAIPAEDTGSMNIGTSGNARYVDELNIAAFAGAVSVAGTPSDDFAVVATISALTVYERLDAAEGTPLELTDDADNAAPAEASWIGIGASFFEGSQAAVTFEEPAEAEQEIETIDDHTSRMIRRLASQFRAKT